jgi:hypothetical protein
MNKGGSRRLYSPIAKPFLKNKTVYPKTPGQLRLISVCWTN